MSFHSTLRFSFAALCFAAGCGGSATEVDTSGLSTTEDSLTAAQDSLASAEEQARACFDTFKTCNESGQTKDVCKEALKSCLPADAPRPRRCGPPPGDGGAPPPRGEGERRGEGDRPPPPSGSAQPPPPPRDDRDAQDGGAEGHHGGRGHGGRHCGPPPVKRERLEACRTSAEGSVAQGENDDNAREAHRRCVRDAFSGEIGALCQEAKSACANPNAPQDICSRITEACATAP